MDDSLGLTQPNRKAFKLSRKLEKPETEKHGNWKIRNTEYGRITWKLETQNWKTGFSNWILQLEKENGKVRKWEKPETNLQR